MKPANGQIAATHIRTRGQRVVRTSQHTWMFPYCSGCLNHLAQAQRVRRRVKAAGWITFVILLAIGILLKLWIICVAIAPVVALMSAWIAHRRFMAIVRQGALPSCACLGPAVRFDGFHGTVHSFSFANSEFAAAFANANARKLV